MQRMFPTMQLFPKSLVPYKDLEFISNNIFSQPLTAQNALNIISKVRQTYQSGEREPKWYEGKRRIYDYLLEVNNETGADLLDPSGAIIVRKNVEDIVMIELSLEALVIFNYKGPEY